MTQPEWTKKAYKHPAWPSFRRFASKNSLLPVKFGNPLHWILWRHAWEARGRVWPLRATPEQRELRILKAARARWPVN